MWNFLSWAWHLITLFAVPLCALAGFIRIGWELFNEGRRYQVRRIREMMGRVREEKAESTEIDGGSK